ncbi:MAG: hypothetical protein H6830_07615 [Planctomycetes bacterium]|nr:hypothetical protein [Planctomycetota bacterium]MCB9910266.1 hypothetical protein [Planctomycetota bacterium]HRV80855.1 hypothetical protein [Planctomycetota bacterium]
MLYRIPFLPWLLVATVVGCSPRLAEPTSEHPSSGKQQPIVRKVDHILLESTDARALFVLLSESLQMPVSWPMADFGDFASGGVSLGNVQLEVLRAGDRIADEPRARFLGFALEPEPLERSLPELRTRQIPFGQPAPFRSRRLLDMGKTLWTTVSMPTISRDAAEIFLCEYASEPEDDQTSDEGAPPTPAGGPLSIRKAREIVYGTTDPQALHDAWRALLDESSFQAPDTWLLGSGPAIRIVLADSNSIRALVIQVASLAQARSFLESLAIPMREDAAAITLHAPSLAGATITLVQGDDAPGQPSGEAAPLPH